VDEWFKSAPC